MSKLKIGDLVDLADEYTSYAADWPAEVVEIDKKNNITIMLRSGVVLSFFSSVLVLHSRKPQQQEYQKESSYDFFCRVMGGRI